MSYGVTPPSTLEEKIEWLQLIRSSNVGPITFYKLLQYYGSARNALGALPSLAKSGKSKIDIFPKKEAEKELKALEKFGAQLIARGEEHYPPLLAHIDDAPPLLQVMGNPAFLKKRTVAIVGARNASANGRNIAQDLARELGQSGFLIASGMARGIDTAAHEGALATGTIAAVAGGLDIIYPRENTKLYQAIREQGVMVSEMPLGSEPQARHFPRRNRIVSGMSRGVIVIEASLKSGSMITARLAQEQGRETLAVPGSPLDPRSKGGNQLIKQGASLIETALDVIEALERPFDPPVISRTPQTAQEIFLPGLVAEPVTKSFTEERLDPASKKKNLSPSDDDARLYVKELLGPSAVCVDDLLRQSRLSPAELNSILLEFELAGLVEWQPGNRVALIS